MSVLVGISAPFGESAVRSAVHGMLAPVADRAPDGLSIWAHQNVGLGFGALWTTAEAQNERQPLTAADASIALCFSGRIDNRDELAALLRARGLTPRDATDAELVCCAYRLFGESFVDHLLGDYALVLWDARKKTMLCACDPMGMRALHYALRDGTFVCATEVAQLLAHPKVRPEPNESVVAQYLSRAVVSEDETLYADIKRVLPGTMVSFGPRGLRTRRFFRFEDAPDIRYADDDEYAEHFRALFDDAVRCRLRSQQPVGVQVSGGLDSSSVFVTAATLLGGAAPLQLRPYTLAFPGQPLCDEVEHVRAVEALTGITIRRFEPDRAPAHPLGTVARTRELPEYPVQHMYDEASAHVRAEGVRVVLTGDGGDDWVSGHMVQYADMLREGRLLTLARQALIDRQTLGSNYWPSDLPRFALWPFVPAPWKDFVRSLRGRRRVLAHVHPELARRTRLEALVREPARVAGNFERSAIIRANRDGMSYQSSASFAAGDARRHLERRAPLEDLRLARFAIGVPRDQRWRGRTTKTVMRHAMKQRLPSKVHQRTDKADFSHVVLADIARRQKIAGELPALTARGWIEPQAARHLVSQMWAFRHAEDGRFYGLLWTAWLLFALEEWAASLALSQPLSAREQLLNAGLGPA